VEVTAASAEGRARSSIVVAAATSILGVAVAGTVSRTAGGVLLVLGWLAFVYAIHSFGRAGSERDERS
jgi:energy-converting hydrogenase Eha subunit C